VNDAHRDTGAVTLDRSRDRASDDVQLLRRISQGDESANSDFYRQHGRVVLAQILLVIGERALAREVRCDRVTSIGRANSREQRLPFSSREYPTAGRCLAGQGAPATEDPRGLDLPAHRGIVRGGPAHGLLYRLGG
jgi:hypothetical protein